jgi:hypothetical protein
VVARGYVQQNTLFVFPATSVRIGRKRKKIWRSNNKAAGQAIVPGFSMGYYYPK